MSNILLSSVVFVGSAVVIACSVHAEIVRFLR